MIHFTKKVPRLKRPHAPATFKTSTYLEGIDLIERAVGSSNVWVRVTGMSLPPKNGRSRPWSRLSSPYQRHWEPNEFLFEVWTDDQDALTMLQIISM